jgi:hypothetical protein
MANRNIMIITGPDGVDCFISKEEYENLGHKGVIEKYKVKY